MDLYEFTREPVDNPGSWVWTRERHATYHDAVIAAVTYIWMYGGRLVRIENLDATRRIEAARASGWTDHYVDVITNVDPDGRE